MLARFNLLLYEVVLLAFSLLIGPLFLLHARGRRRLRERFGLWAALPKDYVWLHAASVGEVAGLVPVLERIRRQYPQYPLLLTCTSPTGLDRGAAYVDQARLLPFDSSVWLRLACRGRLPKLLVVTETELWPALFCFMDRRRVPLVMINARLGERSFARYKCFTWFIRPLLKKLALLSASSTVSAARFARLGLAQESMPVWGNSKYDREPQVAETQRRDFAAQLFSNVTDKQLVVLGSLRPGEEQIWFPALRAALEKRVDLQVVVAPRHQENYEYFAERLRASNLEYARWSQKQCPTRTKIVLLDTMGLLEQAYAAASLAFIGATLVPIGGHNPLEPAAYAVPVCVGPHCKNVAEIIEQLEKEAAVFRIATSADALALLLRVGSSELRDAGQRAQGVWRQNRGASERIVAGLARFL